MIRVAVGCGLSFSAGSADEILAQMPEARLLGQDWHAEQIIAKARSGELDIAVLSLDMPGAGALEVLRRAARFQALGILLTTAHADRSYPASLLRLGAKGLLTRRSRPEQVVAAVSAAYRGERYIAPEIANRLSQSLIDASQRSPFETFTLRQLQVAMLLAHGCKTGTIAGRLHLHAKTVNNHRRQVRMLLDVQDDTAVADLAIQHGLLTSQVACSDEA